MMTGVSKYLVQVLQFIIVLVLAAQFSFSWLSSPPSADAFGGNGKRPNDRAVRMRHAMDTDIAFSAIRISTPLIYAALGGLLTYQAGILNIALDGFMIVAAFAAIAVAYATASLTLGVLAGVVSAIVLAARSRRLQPAFPGEHLHRRHRRDLHGLRADGASAQGRARPGRRFLLGPHSDLSAAAPALDRRYSGRSAR